MVKNHILMPLINDGNIGFRECTSSGKASEVRGCQNIYIFFSFALTNT